MSGTDTDDDRRASGWQRWGGRLLPALTFVFGLGLGLVVMTAGVDQDGAEPDAAPTPTDTASPTPGAGDTVVTVPGACEEAAATLSEATRLLDDVAGSVRDFRPEELVDLLNRLEELDAETRRLAAECSKVSVTESAAPSESAS